jgi:hypothetical protein
MRLNWKPEWLKRPLFRQSVLGKAEDRAHDLLNIQLLS